MISIDPKTNTERENHKLLIGSIIPRPIAFVTSVSKEGIVNGAPFSYFNVVSSNPPMISLSIQRRKGKMKDTARNILTKKAFVVHSVDIHNLKDINETAASLSPDESEIHLTSLTLIESDMVDVPGIKESKVRMECILEKHLSLGEGEKITTDLLIGKVVRFHMDESIYIDGRIDPLALGPLSRLAGISYAGIGEIINLERPD